jgi:protocatechuate 3,4-dioxygenase beta subunit
MASIIKSSRRNFLTAAGLAAGAYATFRFGTRASADVLPPTPACGEAHEPTPRQTAGPFFKPSSPERASFVEPGETARRLTVSGQVLTVRCQPAAGALLDFWHADASGEYDLEGYRYRGHIFADEAGRFEIQTIVPGIYEGRTRHIHVRVQPPGGKILTTQLYFPGEPENSSDFLFNPALLMKLSGESAAFDFVLKT